MLDETRDSGSSSARQLIDVLAEEFANRLRSGEKPSIEEYAARHPEIADEIRDVFPALVIMGQADAKSEFTLSETTVDTQTYSDQIGDFRIIRKVGQGGMGVVYEAQQESLNRRVALKVLPGHIARNEKFIERFRREARAAGKLHHTNIVPVYDVGRDGDTFYYAMQFIEGQGLDDVQREVIRLNEDNSSVTKSSISRLIAEEDSSAASSSTRRRLAYFKSIARIGASVADALGYAHERSIIHRDIKPSNLILDTDGVVWLADFGLARTDDSELTGTGDILGTIRYMSPERFKGKGDHRGDIYALGVTLYELATLRKAFSGEDRMRVIEQIASREPVRPREINRSIPLDFETIILKAMDKEPRRRYQDAAEMAEDLRRFLDDQPIKARRPSLVERIARWTRKHKAQTAAMISMAVAIAALIAGTILIEKQREIAERNERLAKKETERADDEAERANGSADITIEAMTGLVETVASELRNFPELLSLKKRILANAEDKLARIGSIEDDSPKVTSLKIRAFNALAQLNYEVGNYAECDKYFNDSLDLIDGIREGEIKQDELYMWGAEINLGLGWMAFEKHDQDAARTRYQNAYEICSSWVDEFPDNPRAKQILANAADDLGDTYVLLDERNWDAAERFHQEAFNIRRKLRRAGDESFELVYSLVSSHIKLGDMYYGRAGTFQQGSPDAEFELTSASGWFDQAISICEELVEENPEEDTQCLRTLASLYERYADTCEGDEAFEYYMKSNDINERLAPKLAMDRNFQRDLAISWGRTALHVHSTGDTEKAVEYLNKCLSILQAQIARIPDDGGLQVDEMVTWYQLGVVQAGDARRSAWESAREIGERLVENGTIPEEFTFYARVKEVLAGLDD
ncbi:MAG: serine/threonine-protein kinase [Planctomycetota bacterium]